MAENDRCTQQHLSDEDAERTARESEVMRVIKNHPDLKRNPDIQIVDETGSTRKVFEAERKPNSKRNKKREQGYEDHGIEYETHPINGHDAGASGQNSSQHTCPN